MTKGTPLPLLFSLALAPGAGAALPKTPPSHVVIVIEENHGYADIIGSSAAPYLNSLARTGALMTRSFAVTHPSEPNYLELFSGSTQGITDDSCPNSFGAANLGGHLLAAGRTFAGYSEDLPAPGYGGCASAGYARKHNPWVMFTDVPASANLPFSAFPKGHYQDLPTVSFVIPNLGNDMHDGSIQTADAWLQSNLDPYVQWASANNALLIVTFDEDDSGGNNQIATLFHGPMVTPGAYAETITHDNLLRTLEDLYGLAHAGRAAQAAPITDIWAGAGMTSFTITASAGANGSITPAGAVSVAQGGNQSFGIDPASGYRIASVLVDGAEQGPICAYTFSGVTASHSIAASFGQPGQFVLSASAGPGGSISPAGAVAVAQGGSQTFTITPASGYAILGVSVDGASQGAISSYTFSNVLASHSISASFQTRSGPAKVISIDFAGRAAAMAATETAGVFPRSHWNNAAGAAQATPQALVDETGAGTGATVSWSASGVWSLPATGATGDLHMMAGYLDPAGANAIIRIANLPAHAAGYDVLVYADGDNGNGTRSGIYQVSGPGITTTNLTLTDAAGANFTGAYRQGNNGTGNYVRFTINATAFNLTAIPSTSSDGYSRAPVNGIQIIPD